MHVQLYKPCSGFPRQCFTSSEVLNASSTSTSSVDHRIILQSHGYGVAWVFTAGGCQRLWCEPTFDNQSMESYPDAQLPSAILVVDNEQPRQHRTDILRCRPGQMSSLVNANTLRNELRNAVAINISTQTAHNRLRQSGIRFRRACICIALTRLHKQPHLNWAQYHVNWTDRDWDHVLLHLRT